MPITMLPGIIDRQAAAVIRDGLAARASLRTLGAGAQQAAAGDAPAAAITAHVAATDPHADRAAAVAADAVVLATAEAYADTGDALLVPKTRTVTAGTGMTGGGALSANITLAPDFGSTAGKVTQGNDSRLSDARTPTGHGISHAATGSDPIQVSATDKILGRSSSGAGNVEEIACTAAGRALIDDAAASNQRTTLGSTTVGDALFIAATAAAARTALGSTTVGDAVFIAANTAAARTAIGAVIGTDVEAWNANLDALAGLTLAAAKIPVATGSGAMALDDWDRTSGSWTPVVEGAGTAGTNTYDIQVGKYIRRGKMVQCWFRIHATGKSVAMVGNVQIGGLPFTAVNTTNQFGMAPLSTAENMVFTTFPSSLVTANTTKASIYKNTSGTTSNSTNITTADLGTTFGFIGTIIYEAA